MKKKYPVTTRQLEIARAFIDRYGFTNEVKAILAKYAFDLETLMAGRLYREHVTARHEIFTLLAEAGAPKTCIARAFATKPDNVYYLAGSDKRRGVRFRTGAQ